jgi:predicted hydrolase (HD superfamily)
MKTGIVLKNARKNMGIMTMKRRIRQLAKIYRHTKDQRLKSHAFCVVMFWLDRMVDDD